MPKNYRLSRKILLLFLLLVLVGLAEMAAIIWRIDHPKSSDSAQTTSSANQAPTFDKTKYSVNDASSLWVVVNKGRALPSDYVPSDLVVPNVPLYYGSSSNDSHLRGDAASALETLFAAAKAAGYNLKLFSGYRSYGEQAATYNGFVKSEGQAQADISSARPGHSEHQTGLAVDISTVRGACELEQCFGDIPEGKWLAISAYKYGFILRYQKDQESLTGYEYEPWHFRYVGVDLAGQIHKTGQTLEQLFGLPTYTDYPTQSYQLG